MPLASAFGSGTRLGAAYVERTVRMHASSGGAADDGSSRRAAARSSAFTLSDVCDDARSTRTLSGAIER